MQCAKLVNWELKYLRDLGVYEKVDEKEAVAKCGITPVDTKWVDTDKAFEGGAHADHSLFVTMITTPRSSI